MAKKKSKKAVKGNTPHLAIRVDKALQTDWKSEAKKRGMTVTELVIAAVRAFIKR